MFSGKTELKKYKVSPDAVFQLSLQIAYYRLHKAFAATYESASTRQFARGRTETGRTVHNETVEFVLAVDSNAPVRFSLSNNFSKLGRNQFVGVKETRSFQEGGRRAR